MLRKFEGHKNNIWKTQGFHFSKQLNVKDNSKRNLIKALKEEKMGLLLLLSHFSHVFVTAWTVAHQAPPSSGLSSQEHWSGLPCPSPRDWTWISYISCIGKQVLYHQHHLRSPRKWRHTAKKRTREQGSKQTLQLQVIWILPCLLHKKRNLFW